MRSIFCNHENHVRAFIDEGNDVSTTAQIEKALTPQGGVPGARVSLIQGSFSDKVTVSTLKLPGISKLNNFEFEDEGVRVWRVYDVGEWKLFLNLWSNLKGTLYFSGTQSARVMKMTVTR